MSGILFTLNLLAQAKISAVATDLTSLASKIPAIATRITSPNSIHKFPAIGTVEQPAPELSAPEFSSPASQPNQASSVLQLPDSVLAKLPLPAFATSAATTRPASGDQLYAQRLAALQAGKIYTRLPANSFQDEWQDATYHPHYEDWLGLLEHEANAIAQGQGSNRLTVLVGDSISQWFPNDQLPSDRFWLNQGISGDTSAGVLKRLDLFEDTRPDMIHVMVGINDLRAGATDEELIANIQQIMQQLRQSHPDAQIFIHSILPTRLPALASDRIADINQQLAAIAQAEAVQFLDLQPSFADKDGSLRTDLTTDGLHLNPQGYAMWQSTLRWFHLA